MDAQRVSGSYHHTSFDFSRRSLKVTNRPKQRKASDDSKDPRESAIKEELVDAEQNTCYRECITNVFFESFLSALVAKRRSIKATSSEHLSSTTLIASSNDSNQNSYTSVAETIVSEPSKAESQTASYLSNLSRESTGSCPSCASTCMCFWRLEFKNGNVYEGQLNGSLMEGKGTYYWSDGSIYQGEFKDGYPCGPGKLSLPDLSWYKGDFSLGFFHGNGHFNVKSSPIYYSGEWKLSQRHGEGWMLYDTGNWYEGDWAHNVKHGSGHRQYPNGDKYKGNWHDDRINGEGCMMWHNNDYYVGEWRAGYQHGYGEYTWDLIAHDKFVFPNYNWYKGSWVDGLRSGAGLMSFGHESGARLAGMWLANKKHGPGVMVCGNGMVLEKNPLFTEDKPATFVKEEYKYNASSNRLEKKDSALKTFQAISRQIFSKEYLDSLDEESLLSITKSGTNIKMRQYIKLLERKADNECPLKIPIHNVVHDLDLEYFVQYFFKPNVLQKGHTDVSVLDIEQMINTCAESNSISMSCFNYVPSNVDLGWFKTEDTASQQYPPSTTELRNLIINYMPQLRSVYKMYALLCVDDEPRTFEPVLIRLFLWQLYRDIGVTHKGGISIVEVDEMLMKNPNSCLETMHSPWEPIYFWQFLQALVGVAYLLFATENESVFTPSSGFMYHMFKDFLDYKLLAVAGVFQGNCLTHLKDLTSIDAVYRLYEEIGEPHTVEKFLKNTCLRKNQKLPCYRELNYKDGFEFAVQTGANIVVLNHELSYLEKSRTMVNLENDKQKAYDGLYTFSSLGKKKILKSLCKICPLILLPTKRYQLQYKLSFIEFYEALLLLAFEKVEQEHQVLVEELKTQSMSEVKSSSRVFSRMSTHSTAKKKKLKK